MLDQINLYPLNLGLDTPILLLILVALEAVLSADNAIALASITQSLEDRRVQHRALNFGLVAAYFLRVILIVTATWVVQYWQFEVLGAVYLLWLTGRYFLSQENEEANGASKGFSSLWQVIPLIAMTDLAFSLDSVTTAIAVSEETWLVIAGGTIGVICLRFLAELFLRWLEEFPNLEKAGYITVGFVGLRLLLKAISPALELPEWFVISTIALVFFWGFSQRDNPSLPTQDEGQHLEVRSQVVSNK